MAKKPKIVFSGDWHGNDAHAERVITRSRIVAADALVQLGDFGLWPGTRGEEYLENVRRLSELHEMPVYWIDGNHEWHDEIDRMTEEHGFHSPIHMGGQLYYVPRGCRWQIGDVSLGALGGAFSVDYSYRVPFISWWPQELLKPQDVERLGTAPLDILVTHDSPEMLSGISAWRLSDTDEAKCEGNRQLIRQAIRDTGAKRLFHGHWHWRYSREFLWFEEDPKNDKGYRDRVCQVVGLAHDNAERFTDSSVLLEHNVVKGICG